ncbi:MAG: hypothetical protein IPK34_04390 [Ramlibacter sp.]|nr:hypothetical protein [Ramlibacter sp.]
MPNFLAKSSAGVFATRTLTGHLLRGGAAFALLYLAISLQHSHPLAALASGIAALVAIRGCPVCWTIGLAETIGQRTGKGR